MRGVAFANADGAKVDEVSGYAVVGERAQLEERAFADGGACVRPALRIEVRPSQARAIAVAVPGAPG